MKQEDKVISLEMAKRLYELNFMAESDLWWVKGVDGFVLVNDCRDGVIKGMMECYPAYDAVELGMILPLFMSKDLGRLGYKISVIAQGNWVDKTGATEAEARGKMLAWLLENKISQKKIV